MSLYRRLRQQIKYLLGKEIRPKTCKYCGTTTSVSKKYGPSYFTPPGLEPCDICSKHVTIPKEKRKSW